MKGALNTLSHDYDYETPVWAVVLLSVLSLVFGLVAFWGFSCWAECAGDSPQFIKWLFLAISLVFLAAGIRPGNWRPWKYFYADKAGMHFPSECPATRDTDWLTVPWSRVGSIKVGVFANRTKGPSIELRLTDQEIERYFNDIRMTKMFLSGEVRNNGYFQVGYSTVFKNADKAVAILNELKKRYADNKGPK